MEEAIFSLTQHHRVGNLFSRWNKDCVLCQSRLECLFWHPSSWLSSPSILSRKGWNEDGWNSYVGCVGLGHLRTPCFCTGRLDAQGREAHAAQGEKSNVGSHPRGRPQCVHSLSEGQAERLGEEWDAMQIEDEEDPWEGLGTDEAREILPGNEHGGPGGRCS